MLNHMINNSSTLYIDQSKPTQFEER